MKRVVVKAFLLAVVTISAAVGPAMAQSGELAAGDRFPPLKLPRLRDGKLVSLEEFRGQKVVLHVWASW